ncbi:glycine betaine ABC transporter substrate-binding protein [Mycobacteroides abscessus]|uniref:glycine betaine ABC transporter substrate-binding protein n=1 Tax=Mycobacteroides abscessus TaxID=36809 RepID=UPI001A96F91C|nr:glycine betaine ABC transporter substrate-binding protein [Mycobacteroides abscessus]
MRRWTAVLLAAVAVLAGCSENRGPAPYLTVVTTNDAQYRVLAHIYAAVVKATGIDTKVRESADPVTELDTGIASVAPGFTGRVLRRFAPQQRPSGDEETTYKAMIAALPAGVAAADYGTAEDRAALAVTSSPGASAKPTLADFVRHCDQLARGGQVGQGPVPLPRIGSCDTDTPRQYASAGELFAALRRGDVAVAWTSTASPALPADGVTLLDDEKQWLPANSVVPLYRRNELTEAQVLSLNKVAGELTTGDLAAMTREVSGGAEPQRVVGTWLNDHQILLRG